jgi:hypothetical protein
VYHPDLAVQFVTSYYLAPSGTHSPSGRPEEHERTSFGSFRVRLTNAW